MIKQDLARATTEIQRLQTEESEAAAQVSSEQARWAEINQRLGELGRAAAGPGGGGRAGARVKPGTARQDVGHETGSTDNSAAIARSAGRIWRALDALRPMQCL